MKDLFHEITTQAIKKLQASNTWAVFDMDDVNMEYPGSEDHGDVSTNIAMKLAKVLKKSPLHIAEELVRTMYKLDTTKKLCKKIDVLPPGFINFHMHDGYVLGELKNILEKKSAYAKNNFGNNKKLIIEFISANPTGPLTLANGRGGFTGDTLAKVMSLSGYKVKKEYYINDIGNQVSVLAESVTRRMLENKGVTVDYPEHLYKGEYITDIAKQINLKITKKDLHEENAIQKISDTIKTEVLEAMIVEIQRVVKDVMGIRFDYWFRESSLYKGLKLETFINALKEKDIAYEKDGAIWFATTKFGDDKDRVIIKKDGEQTYFMSDILYLMKRFDKDKFDNKILILGADHHGYIKRIQAIASALGHPGKIDVRIMQLVKLMKEGKEVRMSKRKGTFVTIEEVIEEAGLDAVRFFFLMYTANTHMDFNIDLAKEKSEKNPVYYVQYAHARIKSIEREMVKRRVKLHKNKMEPLSHDAERKLIKQLMKFPEVIADVANTKEVHMLPIYTIELARAFHNFYTNCRVIEDSMLRTTRGYILQATKQILAQSLELMGINAPERME